MNNHDFSGMGNARSLWSLSLVIVGGIVMLLGAINPLESCVAILVGSGARLAAIGLLTSRVM